MSRECRGKMLEKSVLWRSVLASVEGSVEKSVLREESRLGITVSALPIPCNGLCTTQRFYDEEQEIRVALDVQMDLTHSLIFYTCPRLFAILNSFMVTGWLTSAKKPSFTWLGYSKNSCEPPVWYHCNGPHWCLCSCPLSTPSKYRESWEHWWLHGRNNPIYDRYHSCLCSQIPGDMSHKTQACNRATQF